MAEATLRTTIYDIVNGVSNVGTVHDYLRWAPDASDFLDRFKTTISNTSVIRGWTVTCESMTQEIIQFNRKVLRRYTYKIRGIAGMDDSAASEKTFFAVAEDVVEALDASDTLHDGSSYYHAGPADITIFELRLFGGNLCHYAEVTLIVDETRSADV